jgi:hypothetical protein
MEGAVETRRVGNQPNLFQPAIQRVVLERAKLLPLLRSLLLEVVFGANTGSPTKESDHE